MRAMSLEAWSWSFLVVYLGAMLGLGVVGQRRVKGADDFATARGSYGPLFLGLAFAATTASGATFLGLPGITYTLGVAGIWSSFLYPCGVYLGVLICMRLVSRAGERFGTRSIPEYLGQRYQSDALRVAVALYSLMLFFYLAGQLVSGLVMFETMLGLSPPFALGITAVVLVAYVTLGGAHADILTDGAQGFVMVLVGAGVIVLFLLGYGTSDGGVGGVLASLHSQDPELTGVLNPNSALTHSWWAIGCVIIAHIPLGLLPHIGNKLWALRSDGDRTRFVKLAFAFGLTLGMLGLGGLLARAVIGDALLAPGESSNSALPALFIEIFPTWLAALLGVGILAAIMSTADGLVVSSSQIVANDLYRCTWVPRYRPDLPEEQVDRQVLLISRVATVVVMLICTGLAWGLMDMNVALVVWIGVGGMMAAFAGPLVLGALWRGVTRAGAYAGFGVGAVVFAVTHGGLIDASWFEPGLLHSLASWLEGEAPSPFSCAAMGEIASLLATWAVSSFTEPLPESQLDDLFGTAEEPSA
jgi:Na+/proline symporter